MNTASVCEPKWLYDLLNKQQETIAQLAKSLNTECKKNESLVEKINQFEERQKNMAGQLELMTDIMRQLCENHTNMKPPSHVNVPDWSSESSLSIESTDAFSLPKDAPGTIAEQREVLEVQSLELKKLY